METVETVETVDRDDATGRSEPDIPAGPPSEDRDGLDAVWREAVAGLDDGIGIVEVLVDAAGQPTDLRILAANRAYATQAGLPADLDGRLAGDLIGPLEPELLACYGDVALERQPQRFAYQSENDVVVGTYEAELRPIGRPEQRRVAVWFRNVTERNRTDEALRRSEERLRLATFATRTFAWQVDSDSGVMEWSANTAEILGFEPPAKLAEGARGIDPEDLPGMWAAFGRAEAGGEGWAEYRLTQPDPETGRWVDEPTAGDDEPNPERHRTIWLSSTYVGLPSVNGRSQRIVGVTQDITDRKRAEAALRDSEERFRTVVQNIPDYAIFLLDREARIAGWWEGAEHLIGYRPEEILGRHVSVFYRAEDVVAGDVEREIAEATTSGRSEREGWRVRRGGDRFWGNEIMTAIHDAAGTVTGFSKITRDLTERRRAEEALRESEERQRFLLDLSDRLRPLADPITAEGEACRLLGEHLGVDRAYFVAVDEAKGYATVERDYHRATAPSLVGRHPLPAFDWIVSLLEGSRPVVIPDSQRSELIPAADRAALAERQLTAFVSVPVVRGGRLIGAVCVTDSRPRAWSDLEVSLVRETAERVWAVVERTRSEAALRSSEARFRQVADLVPDLLWRGDPDGTTTWYNRRWMEYTGQTQAEAIDWGWADAIHPNDRASSSARYAGAVASGQPLRQQHRIRGTDGTHRWFLIRAQPFRDDAGTIVAWFGAATNIDNLKRAEAERERARQQAENAVEARNQFLSIAAHELRNPVAAIKASGQLLQRAVRRGRLDPERAVRYAATITETSERLEILINDLFDVSRLQTGQLAGNRRLTDLAALIRATVYSQRLGNLNHRLSVTIRDGHLLLLDPDRIRQVLVNLLDNAVKYSPDGGTVLLALTEDERGVLLRVSDGGIGLPAESLERIFEPFNRAPNAVASTIPGMGLGLYICRQIAEAHGGRLWAESPGLGQGTTMNLRLPDESAAGSDAAATP